MFLNDPQLVRVKIDHVNNDINQAKEKKKNKEVERGFDCQGERSSVEPVASNGQLKQQFSTPITKSESEVMILKVAHCVVSCT
jgi:hypothetical protein